MNEVPNPAAALGSFLTSILSIILTWISIKDAQVIMAIGGTLVTIISGGFAAWSYRLKGKREKLEIEKLKSELYERQQQRKAGA
jgi:uncharacterized membrane protein YcaP (DUF421 family)